MPLFLIPQPMPTGLPAFLRRVVGGFTAASVFLMPTDWSSTWPVANDVAHLERVPPADLPGVDADLLGQHVDAALHGEGRLVGAEAAHRAAGRIVGVDRDRLDVDVRHLVRPARVTGRRARAPCRPPTRTRRCRRSSAPSPR